MLLVGTGYVSNRLNADGTINATEGKEVRLDEFPDAVLDENQWGTSFQMFDMATGKDEDGTPGDDGRALLTPPASSMSRPSR